MINRRNWILKMALAGCGIALPRFSAMGSDDKIATKSSAGLDEIASAFMSKHQIPGLSVAIARRRQMVYCKAFGVADKTSGEKVSPDHLFRIASVSKPITSVAIFSLIEQSRFTLDDFVFGAKGILGFDYGKDLPERVGKITIRHLLEHTSGGWQNDHNDPMFKKPEFNHKELISWALREHPLKNDPGTHHAYSNFGYCILGRVIEKLTRLSYADYVKQHILAKCGISGMRIAGNKLKDRLPNEVAYWSQEGEDPYDMNVSRMDSHGGWLASAADLVKFASSVDGFEPASTLLSSSSIKTMTTPGANSPGYACGWAVNKEPNWWHSGSLPGTTSIMVRTAGGLCWAALANTRTKESGLALDRFMWQMAKPFLG